MAQARFGRPRRGATVVAIGAQSTSATAAVAALTASGMNREATPLGQSAIALAMALDAEQASASAIAALSRELRATLAEALAGATTGRTPLDELRERQRRRFTTRRREPE